MKQQKCSETTRKSEDTCATLLKAKDIVEIIKACKDANVFRLSLHDLTIDFAPIHQEQAQSLIPLSTAPLDQFTQYAIDEIEEANLDLEDPLEYERRVMADEEDIDGEDD